MKKLLILLACLLLGCTPSHRETIEEAERQLSLKHADSTLYLLHGIYNPEELEPALKGRYVLALCEAHYRLGKAMTEDSLLCEVYDYYRNTLPVDSFRLRHATVLLSSYYWWLDRKPEAYELLEQASEHYEDILPHLMSVYSRDNRFADNKRILLRFIEANREDSSMLFTCLNNLVIADFYQNKYDSLDIIFDEITRNVVTASDSADYAGITLRNFADMYSALGDQRRAIALQQRVSKYYEGRDSSHLSFSYALMSRYHLLLGDVAESARYLELANATATEYIKSNLTYIGYYQIMQILLDYARTGHFNTQDLAIFVNGLENKAAHERKITDAKEESNRLLTERNLHLTISRQRMQILAMQVTFVLVLVIVGLLLYNRRKRRIIEEKEEELETLRQLVQESQQTTGEKDDRFFKKLMLQQLGVIRMAASNPTAANQELIKRMSAIANKEVEVDTLLNWDDLYKTIDYIYEGYYTRLKEQYGALLNEKEIQLCCLLRANFSTKEISIVTQQGVRTVYQRKTVVRQKLGVEEKGDIAAYLA